MEIKSIALGVAAIMILAGGLIAVNADKPGADDDYNGNNAPSGAHYNLNIIGVPNEMNSNFNGGNGARIFVLRDGMTKFYVQASNHFEILDHDATDGECGESQGAGLPGTPGLVLPYEDDEWKVQIYIRLLGPKTSEIKWKSYYFDGGEYIKFYDQVWDRDTKFSLKTGQLLKDGYENILWQMENKTNFRILQMRIYLT